MCRLASSALVSAGRMGRMKREMVAAKLIPACGEGLIVPDDRMHLLCEVLTSVGKQQPFTSLVAGDASYVAYRSELGAEDRANLDAALTKFTPNAYSRIDLAAKVFEPFKHAVHEIAAAQLPLSAYFPLVITLQAALLAQVRDPIFDATFGVGAGTEVEEALKVRFNTNGKKPADLKIGMLDPHHLFAFFCDPFSRDLGLEWHHLIDGGVAGIVNDLLEWAYPGDSTAAKEMRCKMESELVAFNTGTGIYKYKFADYSAVVPLPLGHMLTMKDVSGWAVRTGGIESRIAWFEMYAKDALFYRDIAKPLLSSGMADSVAVERMAKPLKNALLTEDRSRLLGTNSELLVRAGLNLRFLQHAKKEAMR